MTGSNGQHNADRPSPIDRPNIVVVLCDQLRAFEVGCYDNDVIRTPHIDRLAGEGVRFEHAVSNNPVCMAARSALLTGQYSRSCQGFLGNYARQLEDGTKSMPEYPVNDRPILKDAALPEQLKAVGYETNLIGKWHVHPAPYQIGFDYSLYPRVHHRHTGQTFVENQEDIGVVDGFSIDYEAQAVREYLDTVGDRPFFLHYCISPPHMPLDDAPDEYKRMYSPEEVPIRPNCYLEGELPFDERWFKIYLWDFLFYEQHLPYTESLPDGFGLRQLTAMYYGLTTWVDDQVGRLMAGLEANGLADNTIVVFLSDHGDNLGSHHLFNKGKLIEESIRIPLIFHCPARWSSRVSENQVGSIVDIMPTLLGLAGVIAPASIQGRDLSPVIYGDAESLENTGGAFVETGDGEIGVRTPTHLFGMRLDGSRSEIEDEAAYFFDLIQDPYEQNNLANTSEQLETADRMAERLRHWHYTTPWCRPPD
ncbi:MAG: sulfatase-like hydrolase/transferase [Candidatus Latescibacterota bacterium]|nr:sulfatase-like hydrolase/transferase [Candidatus Latescibacterota bacterium]